MYLANILSPPGKDMCVPALLTSQGSRRVVTLDARAQSVRSAQGQGDGGAGGAGGRSPHHRVELAALELALVAREGEHRGVAVGVVVREGEAVLDGLGALGRGEVALLVLGEPAVVAARDVPACARARVSSVGWAVPGLSDACSPGTSNIAHYENVLRLGDCEGTHARG